MATTRICSIQDCNKTVNARGLCGTHYQRLRQYGDPSAGGPVIDRNPQSGPCSVSGCTKGAKKRGMCDPHYRRFMQHGDPQGGSTFRGEPMEYILSVAIHYSEPGCLIWPYARASNGYAHIRHDGGATVVSRTICEMRHGPAPTTDHEAAHSCGKGHEGCIAPDHLRWATSKENQADKIIHGTTNRGENSAHARLTKSDVREIRRLARIMPHKEIAPMFGVEWKTVSAISERRRWAWLPD